MNNGDNDSEKEVFEVFCYWWRHEMEEMWCHSQKYPRERQEDDCVMKWRRINKTNLSKEGVFWRNQKKCQRSDLIPEEWREGIERVKRRELKSMEICERGKEGRINGSEVIGTNIVKWRIVKEQMMKRSEMRKSRFLSLSNRCVGIEEMELKPMFWKWRNEKVKEEKWKKPQVCEVVEESRWKRGEMIVRHSQWN